MSTEPVHKHYSTTQEIITQTAGLLLVIPLAPFICRFIPPIFLGSWNFDMIIAVIMALVIVRLLQWLIKPMIIPAFVVTLLILIYNSFSENEYSFDNIASGYTTLVKQNWKVREQKQTDQLSFNPHLLENGAEKVTRMVKSKVQYKDSVVRNFSVTHSLENFDMYQYKYKELCRYFSLFKYINSHFKYVPDVQRDEYYATPKETILNGLGGDCDDHSILMASCLMSIGATCRLIIVQGHMYPELYVGDKNAFDIVQAAVVQFFGEDGVDRIYYHENNGEYWINLDYTAPFPGGPYMNDDVKLLINLP